MFDVIVFENNAPVWCVNLAPLAHSRAEETLRMATAIGAAWHGKDVRIIAA